MLRIFATSLTLCIAAMAGCSEPPKPKAHYNELTKEQFGGRPVELGYIIASDGCLNGEYLCGYAEVEGISFSKFTGHYPDFDWIKKENNLQSSTASDSIVPMGVVFAIRPQAERQ